MERFQLKYKKKKKKRFYCELKKEYKIKIFAYDDLYFIIFYSSTSIKSFS